MLYALYIENTCIYQTLFRNQPNYSQSLIKKPLHRRHLYNGHCIQRDLFRTPDANFTSIEQTLSNSLGFSQEKKLESLKKIRVMSILERIQTSIDKYFK